RLVARLDGEDQHPLHRWLAHIGDPPRYQVLSQQLAKRGRRQRIDRLESREVKPGQARLDRDEEAVGAARLAQMKEELVGCRLKNTLNAGIRDGGSELPDDRGECKAVERHRDPSCSLRSIAEEGKRAQCHQRAEAHAAGRNDTTGGKGRWPHVGNGASGFVLGGFSKARSSSGCCAAASWGFGRRAATLWTWEKRGPLQEVLHRTST